MGCPIVSPTIVFKLHGMLLISVRPISRKRSLYLLQVVGRCNRCVDSFLRSQVTSVNSIHDGNCFLAQRFASLIGDLYPQCRFQNQYGYTRPEVEWIRTFLNSANCKHSALQ